MDWLACVPVYRSLAEIDEAMRQAVDDEAREEEALQDDEDDEGYGSSDELALRDVVLTGLCAYLAESYPEPLREMVYSVLDIYCGKPVVVSEDFFARREKEKVQI